MKTALARTSPTTTAALLVLLAATTFGCDGSLGLAAAAGGDADIDTDTDSDADPDTEPAPPQPDPESDEADCDTVNAASFHIAPADSNSMAGPVWARFLINHGQKVDSEIRINEFLNYYRFDYAPPDSGPVRVAAQIRPTDEDGSLDLQIGVRALDLDPAGRRALNVTLAIDTSESMAGTPIQRAKQICVALANSLRTGDVISMVTWDAGQNAALQSHAAQGPGDATVIGRCNALAADDADDLHAGLTKAYALAALDFDPARINRVVLVSDGAVEVSAEDTALIAAHADDAQGEAIYLVGVGVGDDDSPDHYSDTLMRAVTAAGKGAHIFIDSAEEATEMFGDRLVSLIEIAARDVLVDLTLPPTFELAEEQAIYTADPIAPEPQHLSPGDAMVFQLAAWSCDSSVPTEDDPVLITATYQDPITREAGSTEFELTLGELLEHDASALIKGGAVTAYARTLHELQGLDGQAAIDVIAATRAQVQLAAEALEGDADLAEIDEVLAGYAELF